MKNRVTAHLTRLRLLTFCASLLFVVCASLIGASVSVNAGFTEQGTQQAQTVPAGQTQPAEKTVEQTQKNIQVLNGLPASQLVPVMNYMGSSLGVKCTFCHVKNGD